jgi:Na+/proline symporter
MKTGYKIIIAGVAGTTLMTLYSYYKANKEKQQYREPVLLNKLINRSEVLPDKIHDNHPAGWVSHYAVGILFVTAYYLFWKKALHNPTPYRIAVVGALSGGVAIAAWKLMFASNDNPPDNNRYGYYRQLFIAHIIFSISALAVYKISADVQPGAQEALTS